MTELLFLSFNYISMDDGNDIPLKNSNKLALKKNALKRPFSVVTICVTFHEDNEFEL